MGSHDEIRLKYMYTNFELLITSHKLDVLSLREKKLNLYPTTHKYYLVFK